ncbi:MAG: hypothetical protein KGK07_15775 [Chloroflexota bacterium]|nr:hypothetical protein [Chloroflexota bacterium]
MSGILPLAQSRARAEGEGKTNAMRNLGAILVIAAMATGLWACGESTKEERTATAMPAASTIAPPPKVAIEEFRAAWNANVRRLRADALAISALPLRTVDSQAVPGATPPATIGPSNAFRHEFSSDLLLSGQLDSDGRFLCTVTLTWLRGADVSTLAAAREAMLYAIDPRMDPTGADEVLYHLGFLNSETYQFKTTTRHDGIEYAALKQSEGYLQAFFYNPHEPHKSGGSRCG